jgi:hypothetical protein
MRKKILIFLCAFIVLLIALLWLPRIGSKLKRASLTESVGTSAPTVGTVKQLRVNVKQSNTSFGGDGPPDRATPEMVDSVAPQKMDVKVQAEIEAKNVPFDFNGRAIDQDSNSLGGVKFKFALRHWSTTTLGAIHIERETDREGRFDIHDETGDGFDVEDVRKEGYELEPGQRTFGAVGGSFDAPVLFKMWDANVHEQLIKGGKSFHIEPDGRPYVIDLAKGTIAESGDGDLRVWIRYAAQIVPGHTYDWSCEIDVIGGGLLEESDLNASMYVAPLEGYSPTFRLRQQINGGQRGSIGTRRFYVKLKKGQEYGRITIDLNAPYNDEVRGRVRVEYALNRSGSRILR